MSKPTPDSKHSDPPDGYEVECTPNDKWCYHAVVLGNRSDCDFATRYAAVMHAWAHRTFVIMGSRLEEEKQPHCAACGWPKDRGAPSKDEEPPIVRGALDVQAEAERRLFEGLPGRLSAMSTAQIWEMIDLYQRYRPHYVRDESLPPPGWEHYKFRDDNGVERQAMHVRRSTHPATARIDEAWRLYDNEHPHVHEDCDDEDCRLCVADRAAERSPTRYVEPDLNPPGIPER